MAPDDGITYSIKEVFERLDGKLDSISEQLSAKADQSQVDKMEERVEAVENKQQTLSNRIAYATGGVAVLVVAVEAGIRIFA